jgi:hypothetical protein
MLRIAYENRLIQADAGMEVWVRFTGGFSHEGTSDRDRVVVTL